MDAALPWRISLFGGLRIGDGDDAVTRFRTQKTGALLAYLALNLQRAHAREELADLFWPDIDPEAARTNLRTALSSLRRQLEPPGVVSPGAVLVTRGHFEVGLNPAAVAVDVLRFDRAIQTANRVTDSAEQARLRAEAVALYRGPLLPGFYEAWVLSERNRLSETLQQTLAQLAEYHGARGEWDAALGYARRAVQDDPLAETGYAHLIRALMASGQTTAARREFDDLAALFQDKLGMTPSPEVAALLHAPTPVVLPAAPAPERLLPQTPTPAPDSPAPVRLPLPLNGFWGREDELVTLSRWLDEAATRLVTLTGPGGSGKTRLALETARQAASRFPGGVWFVPLADLRDAGHVPGAIADALGLARATTGSPLAQVTAALAAEPRPVLLVLDNLEQLMETDAGIAEEAIQTLLTQVPQLTCLVTSRRRLLLDGEREFAVMPLPTPLHPGTPERLLEFASVQLFVQRAQTARPDFQITPRNAEAIAALCARLEGIPLALELAAGWAQTLPPAQILARLEKRFDLLVGRRRGVPERHLTLRAAIEWGWDLLTPEQRRCFAQLSVFRGAWDLAAAEAVTDCPDALGLVTELRERSFLVTEPTGDDGIRFRMLETLREFAAEQLSPVERAAITARHGAYFLRMAETVTWEGAAQQAWLARMDDNLENLRAALDNFAAAGAIADEMRLGAALFRFWLVRGHLAEGRARLDAALARGNDAPATLRGQALLAAGSLAGQQGDLTTAGAQLEASLPLFAATADQANRANALSVLANVYRHHGDYARSEAALHEALALYRAESDNRGVARALAGLGGLYGERTELEQSRDYYTQSLPLAEQCGDTLFHALILHNLGVIATRLNDPVTAQTLLLQSLAIRRESNDRAGLGATLEVLGTMAWERGDGDAAEGYYAESLAIHRQMQNRNGAMRVRLNQTKMMLQRGDIAAGDAFLAEAITLLGSDGNKRYSAYTLEMGAFLALRRGQPENAARLWGAAEALREAIGSPLTPQEADEYAADLRSLRAALGTDAFDTARAAGRALDWTALVALMQAPTPARVLVAG